MCRLALLASHFFLPVSYAQHAHLIIAQYIYHIATVRLAASPQATSRINEEQTHFHPDTYALRYLKSSAYFSRPARQYDCDVLSPTASYFTLCQSLAILDRIQCSSRLRYSNPPSRQQPQSNDLYHSSAGTELDSAPRMGRLPNLCGQMRALLLHLLHSLFA